MPRLIALLALACLVHAAPGIETSLDVKVPMRDGVKLSANLFRPAGAGKLPTILVRTPYGKGKGLGANYRPFVENGFAVLVQDVRGKHQSEGVFDLLYQEPGDGEDTLNWIARQPWSDGKIGMVGGSYLGIVQWKVALRNNPHLKAIFPVVSGCDDYSDRYFSRGGAMKVGNRLLWMSRNMAAPNFQPPEFDKFVWHLPLRTADRAATGQRTEMYQKVLDHPAYDSFWKSISTREQLDKIRIPVFAVGGWYDNFVENDLEAFAGMRNSPEKHLLIGPWPHNMSMGFANVDYGPHSKVPVQKLQLEWYNRWLKGQPGAMRPAPLRIFVMGWNQWRDEGEWPLARARPTPFYLTGKGKANTLKGDGGLRRKAPRREAVDEFEYHPRNPVPTRGGAVCCNPTIFPWGPMDQREVEARPDVLVYTTPPLEQDTEVTGPVLAVLYVSTSAPDTDFTAKLVDVFPDGQARNLTDGILRLRYRESLEKPLAAAPGQVYRITIHAGVTSNVFLKGHRIRLEVSSSNFPRFSRNLNTGKAPEEDTGMAAARQKVYHGPQRASHLLLPLVPAAQPNTSSRLSSIRSAASSALRLASN